MSAGVAPSIGAQPTLLVKHEEESPVRPTARTNDDVLRVDSGAPDVLPDVRGLSAREALRRLIARGLRPHFSGDGIVVEQKPEAGTPLAEALDCHLKLARVAPEEPPAETEERP